MIVGKGRARGLGDLQLPLKQGRRESGGCSGEGDASCLYVSKCGLCLSTTGGQRRLLFLLV